MYRSYVFCLAIALLASGCFMTGFDDNANALSDGDGLDGGGDVAGDGDGDGAGDGDGDTSGDGDRAGDGDGDGDGDAGIGDGDGDSPCEGSASECPECAAPGIFCIGGREVTCSESLVATSRECGNDGNECTVGACVDGKGCAVLPVEGDVSCGAGLFCNAPGRCSEGACVHGDSIRDCSGLDGPCSLGQCNETKAKCEAVPANPGASCGQGAVCEAGVCRASLCEAQCSLSCVQEARNCRATCQGALECDVRCEQDATCDINCGGAQGACTVACESGSQCHVTCGALQSCSVDCADDAACMLQCGDQDNTCGFATCADPLDCGAGLLVCGRPCPAIP